MGENVIRIENSSRDSGIGIGFILFLVFLVLKLTGTIGWSWWWVFCPLWAPIALFVAFFLAVGVIWSICSIIILIYSLFPKKGI